jgi:hypothetical protein
MFAAFGNVDVDIGVKVLTAVVMKGTTIFWDLPPCSPLRNHLIFLKNTWPHDVPELL